MRKNKGNLKISRSRKRTVCTESFIRCGHRRRRRL